MKEKEEYSLEGHSFVFMKSAGKSYCWKCGFVPLNNDFSRWANDKGCMNELHPGFKNAKHKFTKLLGEK